jgi:hypothetical protein
MCMTQAFLAFECGNFIGVDAESAKSTDRTKCTHQKHIGSVLDDYMGFLDMFGPFTMPLVCILPCKFAVYMTKMELLMLANAEMGNVSIMACGEQVAQATPTIFHDKPCESTQRCTLLYTISMHAGSKKIAHESEGLIFTCIFLTKKYTNLTLRTPSVKQT